MDARKTSRTSLIMVVSVVAAACAATACTAPAGTTPETTANPKAAVPVGTWPYPNGDLANTRDAAGATISSANVRTLKQAWTFKLPAAEVPTTPGFGSLAATPIVTNGVVYLQDLGANVYALALSTGKLKWEYKVSPTKIVEGGPNGVAVTGGVVYGDTMTTVFALSARTGQPIWVDRHLLNGGEGTFGIQPQVAGGRVYLASSIGTGPEGGVLLALNAATGKPIWRFGTLLSGRHSQFGAGGAWEPPLVGADGSVTFGIGNPYRSAAQAIASPSPQLYSDSDVNLDAATGKLRWYYQGVANDFMDHDMQTSPIAADIKGTPAIIGSGKMGVVYAMNAGTGKLIWKTPVGRHGQSDTFPLEAMDHKLTLKAPYSILPGSLGGVLSDLALAGNSVYAATVDLRFTLAKMSAPLGAPDGRGSGEIEALNLTTGKVEWDTKVPSMPLGATTVSTDLVLTTLYTGLLVALNRDTGAIVYTRQLPTSANAPIAVAGNTILVPAGGPNLYGPAGGSPQLLAYTVR
jgi:alcohol dehydrogenase (cytochrome c)